MAKKTWYRLLSLLVCLALALPYASATEARPDADADEVAYLEADGESDSEDGETSDPEDGETSDPEDGENSDPENGEEPNPENGEEPNPEDGETSDPENGGDPDPQDGENSDPEDGKDPAPGDGEEPNPEERDYQYPFGWVERTDHYLSITSYKAELGDDGILEIPATIETSKGDFKEVKEISSLFGNDSNSNVKKILKEVRIPEGVQILGKVFQNCTALETVHIPSTLETATSPFSGCPNLKNVEFRVGLPRVPATLFKDCTGLTSITLPAQMTVVEKNAFNGCSSLETIIFNDHPYLTEIQDSAFQGCASLKNLSLPSGLRTMGKSAFANCAKLEKVWIPASLSAAGSASSPVFAGCPNLSGLKTTVKDGIENIEKMIEFEATASSIAANLFAKCSGLKQIYIPDTIDSIGADAFAESGLTSVNIPNSVTSYGAKTFRNCANLTEASLSFMAPQISERMFYQCYSLDTLSVKSKKTEPKPEDPDEVISSIGKEAFYECKRLTNLPKWGVLESIGASAFLRCELLASITLPECLTSIGANVFQYDAMLNKVVLPSTLTTIPKYAFAQCYRLADISIPKSVKTIADYAFYQDTDLKRVFIPASVTSISDKEAFSYVDLMIIEGASGSYAEEWAARNGAKEFVDKSVPVEKISLAGGANSMILPKGGLVAPVFEMYPADNTDVLTLTSSNSSVAIRKGYILYCAKAITEPVTVTATATSGFTFEFTVTCEEMTGLDICYPPEVTDYLVGDTTDWDGLVPGAVFKSGAVQPLYNYPPTADTITDKILAWTADELDTESEGTKPVKVSYDKFSTEFSAQVYADADEIPFTLRRVEQTANGVRVVTNGVAGEARYCAVVAFDADGRFAGVGFKTLSDADVASGYADFSGVAANAASVKAYLFNDDEAFAPVQFTRPFSVA